MAEPTLLRCIPARDIAGGLSLDLLRSSGDTGSDWIGASVEEQGPPAMRLASITRGTPITRHTFRRLPAADRSTAVQEIHLTTTDDQAAALVWPGSAHWARLISKRDALVNC